jgi:hemerythrin-like domain-containing protein
VPTVGDALEREHREIDGHLETFETGVASGEWRAEELSRAAVTLRRHIYVEETRVFPLLREAGLFGPVAVMLREHGEIWQALDEVEASNLGRSAASSALASCEQLTQLLDAHNRKEEAILYPATDRMLEAKADAELRSFLQEATLPEGWVCESRRS